MFVETKRWAFIAINWWVGEKLLSRVFSLHRYVGTYIVFKKSNFSRRAAVLNQANIFYYAVNLSLVRRPNVLFQLRMNTF